MRITVCVCVCVCVTVCVCVCMYVYMYECMYVYMYVCMYIYVYALSGSRSECLQTCNAVSLTVCPICVYRLNTDSTLIARNKD